MESKEITEARFIEFMASDFPNFKITKNNLTHPVSQFVISFYSMILRNIIELNDPDEVWNITEDQRCYINSYHAEAVTFSNHVWSHNLYEAIKFVFSHLSENGTEFVYSDILFPENTPRRSFVFMALMLNFYWYSNDFFDELNGDITAYLEKAQLIKNLKNEKESLVIRLKELEYEKSQYAENLKDKKKILMKNSEANEEKENAVKELLSVEETVLGNIVRAEGEKENLQLMLTKIQNENKYLESLIVSNENQVKDNYEKRVMNKDECVRKMKSLEEHVKTASNELVSSNLVLKLQQRLNQLLKEERFIPDSEGKHQGFKSIPESITTLIEKKKKLVEEELLLKQKIKEAEDVLPKLNHDYCNLEAELQKTVIIQKEAMHSYISIIDNCKKNHSQILAKMRKHSEAIEEFASSSHELNAKYAKLQNEIQVIDSTNQDLYQNYYKELKHTLSSIDSSIGHQKTDAFQFNLTV